MLDKLRSEAKKLFQEGKIDLLIGYEKGTVPGRARPLFAHGAEDCDRLIFDPFCFNVLTSYLPRYHRRDPHLREWKPTRVGLVGKGCDVRAVIEQLKEHQALRDHLVILGVPCQGTVDVNLLQQKAGHAEIRKAKVEGGKVTLEGPGLDQTFPLEEVLRPACKTCATRNPSLYDVFVGDKADPPEGTDDFADVKTHEGKGLEEKFEYFQKEMSNCIRCYACRQACPGCYCPVCFVDESLPRWVGTTLDASDVGMFQMMRIYHLAGRCVDCGACADACPMGIDLRTYTRKVVKEAREQWDHTAGTDTEAKPALCDWSPDDPQAFITEPE